MRAIPVSLALLALALLALALAPRSDPEPPAAAVSFAHQGQPRAAPAPDAHLSSASEAARAAVPAPLAPDPAPNEEQPLQLRITTVERDPRGGRPVGSVELVVGLGEADDPNAAVLATPTSDRNGLAALELPAATVAAAREAGAKLWARPSGAGGWRQVSATIALTERAASEPLTLALQVARGITVRGMLLGPDGRPCAGYVQAGPGGSPPDAHAPVGKDGHVVMHLAGPGTYDLVATAAYTLADRSVHVPTARLLGFEVASGELPAELELSLGGEGIVRGHVQDGARRPVTGLELEVRSTEAGPPDSVNSSLQHFLMVQDVGGLHAVVRTDEAGAFEVRGLRTDRYRLLASGRDLMPEPVYADGQPLVVVFDRPHLVVRVVGPGGEPWTGELAHQLRRRPKREAGGWHPVPRLVVTPAAEAIGRAAWGAGQWSSELRGEEDSDGALRFDVEAGRSYLVGLLGGELAWQPVTVDVPAGAGRIELDVVATASPGRGTVQLTVVGSEGPLANGFEVLVEDADTGRVLLAGAGDWKPGQPALLELPAGRLRVAVEGRAGTDFQHGTVYRHSAHGRAEQVIDLRPGGTLPVELSLPAGARIDLELSGQPLPADREAVEAWLGEGRQSEADEWVADAEVWLVAEGRWPRGVDFFHEGHPILGGSYLSSYLRIGTRQLSEPVPAGRWRLEARMPGGRTASTELELRDGETAVVKLEL